MSIQNNTSKINELIEKINALPEAKSDSVLQSKSVTPSEAAQTVTPDNGYDGLSSVSVGAISKTYVGSGVTRKSAQTYTPGTTNQTIASGQYLNGTQTIAGDADLVAGNIKKGVTIFNVTGTLETAGDPALQSKTVSPSTSSQTVTPDSGYDGLSQVTVNAMPTATQATPSITVDSNGLITASATQTSGYVSAGTKSGTKQLTTQAAKTVTPGTSDQTAVASGRYTTGAVTVKGDSNLVAGNIKKSVSIFGVTGTYEGSGGGGGGLPEGIKKLVTGVYTPTSNDTSDFTVTHNFGEMPTFMLLMLCADTGTALLGSQTKIIQFQSPKLIMASSSTLNKMRGAEIRIGSSGSVSTGGLSDSSNAYATTTTATFKGNSTYPLVAGESYQWVVGVLSNVAK